MSTINGDAILTTRTRGAALKNSENKYLDESLKQG
jgi:hypothetical protein